MMAKSCSRKVENALRFIPGVSDVVVSLKECSAVVRGTPDPDALVRAVNKTGKVASVTQSTGGRLIGAAHSFQAFGGRGISCKLGLDTVHCGNEEFMREMAVAVSPSAEAIVAEAHGRGDTCICVAVQGLVIGVAALSDTLREEAQAVVAALNAMKIQVFIATGDHVSTATRVAEERDGPIAP